MGVTDYIVWEDPTTRSSSRSLFSDTRNGPPKRTLHTYIHSYIKHTPEIADWLSLDQIGALLASSNHAQQYPWLASGFWPWQELDTSDWKMSNSYSTITKDFAMRHGENYVEWNGISIKWYQFVTNCPYHQTIYSKHNICSYEFLLRFHDSFAGRLHNQIRTTWLWKIDT